MSCGQRLTFRLRLSDTPVNKCCYACGRITHGQRNLHDAIDSQLLYGSNNEIREITYVFAKWRDDRRQKRYQGSLSRRSVSLWTERVGLALGAVKGARNIHFNLTAIGVKGSESRGSLRVLRSADGLPWVNAWNVAASNAT